jgi:hypothetical protein
LCAGLFLAQAVGLATAGFAEFASTRAAEKCSDTS